MRRLRQRSARGRNKSVVGQRCAPRKARAGTAGSAAKPCHAQQLALPYCACHGSTAERSTSYTRWPCTRDMAVGDKRWPVQQLVRKPVREQAQALVAPPLGRAAVPCAPAARGVVCLARRFAVKILRLCAGVAVGCAPLRAALRSAAGPRELQANPSQRARRARGEPCRRRPLCVSPAAVKWVARPCSLALRAESPVGRTKARTIRPKVMYWR